MLLRCVPERNVTSDPEVQKKIAEDPLWYKGGLKLNMGTLLVECVKVIEGLELSFSSQIGQKDGYFSRNT